MGKGAIGVTPSASARHSKMLRAKPALGLLRARKETYELGESP